MYFYILKQKYPKKMDKKDKKIKNRPSKRNNLLMISLLIASILLTVYFMPKERSEFYDYTIGKPWTYDVLIAPFNFSIEKSDAVYQQELDSLRSSFSPYFSRNTAVMQSKLQAFDQYYSENLYKAITLDSYNTIKNEMVKLYEKGIISVQDESMLEDGKTEFVRIYSGNNSTFVASNQIYNEKKAYQALTQADISSIDRYLLLQHNLENYIAPNLVYDKERSEKDLKDQENSISHFKGKVVTNQKIIDHGDIVTEETAMIIDSYVHMMSEHTASRNFKLMTWGGQLMFVSLMFLCLFMYLKLYRTNNIINVSQLFFIFSTLTLFSVIIGLYVEHTNWSVFMIPCAMLAIAYRIFLDSRTAFMTYMVFVLATSIVVQMPYEYILLQTGAGLMAIYSLKELSQRSQILRTTLMIFVTYCLIWISIQMMQLESLADLDLKMFIYFAINSILLLLIYPLLFVVEKLFGFISNVTLIELSNINNPLLRKLAENAPGTFQHSMQVSTLAAEAANRVGANVQLVRTAALYHDIGKLANPPFFVENQNGTNPHDNISPVESAHIITNHVEEGLRLAEKNGLPESVKEFIRTHHGNGVARYFYVKQQQLTPDTDVNTADFSYPGPNPQTKETAILMMADAVEAASRSLKEITEESISNLVEKIIDFQMSEKFFTECPLSYKDISNIKEVFKEKLKTMYHTRISYPESPKADQRQS